MQQRHLLTSVQFSEFTYAVCLFDHVEQTDRSMHTVSLGRNAVVCAWHGDVVHVKRTQWRVPGKEVLFTNGDMCHGTGAARSVKVRQRLLRATSS